MNACTGTCVAERVERIGSKSNGGMGGEWIRKKVNGEKKIKKILIIGFIFINRFHFIYNMVS